MAFLPPINLGSFKPSPATLAQWVYDIWQYLQENPIATQEQLQEYIATFITTSPETQELIGEGVEQYLTDNPPQAPVQSVQGKTGAVTLAFNDILKNNNTAPVYRAASMPSQSTLQAQYNLGYRLFVNTTTQEIYSITNTGSTTLVGKGKFDGTDIDLDTDQGDTTIAEAITAINNQFTTLGTTEYILPWGLYAPNRTYELTHPFTDYKYIIVYSGAASDGEPGGTHQSLFVKAGVNEQMGFSFVDHGAVVNGIFKFSDSTHINYMNLYNVTSGGASTSQYGIRGILGVKI